VKKENSRRNDEPLADKCPAPTICPLSRVAAGTTVCVRELIASPELSDRLREMGLCEDQRVKLVSRQNSIICQVCNARIALSERLAESILVEPV
jgi:Fe2+ transport system protein FeoA